MPNTAAIQKSCKTCLTNCTGSIVCHITLVINTFGGGHTHTPPPLTKAISRSQAHANLQPPHAWLKFHMLNYQIIVSSIDNIKFGIFEFYRPFSSITDTSSKFRKRLHW